MNNIFTPQTPLGLQVQKLLLENRDGLRVQDLRHALRRKGLHIEEHNLRELLADRRLFIELPDDRYRLRGEEDPAEIGEISANNPAPGQNSPNSGAPVRQTQERGQDESTNTPVLLANLALARQDFVTLDLETTGLDTQFDQIIQLVAIRYQAGRPVAAHNYYFNPAPRAIPFTLKLKLGLDRQPAVEQAILNGPSFAEQAAEIRAFLGELPIVTHNARFDLAFLRRHWPDLPNLVVDNLELAVLLCPALADHRLETLVEHLGQPYTKAGEVWQQATGALPDLPIGQATLHNAITDTCVLALVYQALLQRWYDPTVPGYPVRQGLLPESFGEEWSSPPQARPWLANRSILPATPTESLPEPGPGGWEGVEELLGRYLAARHYDRRPGQAHMVSLVWESLSQDHFKLIEAPTGTGKTIAGLIPSVVKATTEGEQVLLSTAYRNLQDQLIAEIEQLRQLTGEPFRYQLLKGIANYPCAERLAGYIEELDDQAGMAERYVLAYLVLRLQTVPQTTLDDLSYWVTATFGEASSVYRAISAANGSCQPQRCGEMSCPLLLANAGAATAHLLIVNHDLWLTDPNRLPACRYAIFDEAHTLEEVATRAYTEEVSRHSLSELLNRLLDRRTRRGLLPRIMAQASPALKASLKPTLSAVGLCQQLINDFGDHLAAFIRACQGRGDPRHGLTFRLVADPRRTERTRWNLVEGARSQLFDTHLPDLLQLLDKLALALDGESGFEVLRAELVELIKSLREQVDWQRQILAVNNQKKVYWIEIEPSGESAAPELDPVDAAAPSKASKKAAGWALKAAPVRVDQALQERYATLRAGVFVSATLAIRGGDFSFFIDRLGLADWLDAGGSNQSNTHLVEGDLDYRSNAVMGLVNYLDYTPVERTLQSFQEEVAGELKLLLEFTEGRALVLFTARERMQQIYERCQPYLAQQGIPLYWQAPGTSRRRLQEDFAARKEAVLLGLQSFWEGIDVPGESLSFVIIEKLPFPYLFDPVFRARTEEVAGRGLHEFADYIFPLMAIRFKQGFGRLLRTRTDRGAVLLLDKRIHRKQYKYELLSSLPGFRPRDEAAERSRPLFYRHLSQQLPELLPANPSREEFIAALPGGLSLELEKKLADYRLPAVISPGEYLRYRPTILAALATLFGHKAFRSPEQEAVVAAMLSGQDVLALLPTGAGKSLCFQLTALLREGLTIVFSPLIALMRDQVQSLNARGIEIISAIYSGQRADEREEILARLRAGKLKLVYISPERLRDPQLITSLAQAQVTQVVVDEAHCVAMWGPSFRPDFLYLPRLFELLPSRPPLAAFTATATPAIRGEITSALQMPAPQTVVASFDRPELKLVVYNSRSKYNRITSKNKRVAVLLKILEAADYERDSALVYVATTVEAEILARRLRQAGHDARAYHGKLSSAERDNVQEMFMDDQINIVVCTKAFGMGIDKSDIRYVIHFNTPGDLESYYQEAGRAGRDGKEAYCILLHHDSDRQTQEFFLQNGRSDPTQLARLFAQIDGPIGQTLQIDPQLLRERLGLDEVELKIGLHLLEQAGFIERGADFTLRGSLTFFEEPASLVAGLEPAQAELLTRLSQTLGWPVHRRVEIDLLEAAQLVGTNPVEVDALLIALAVSGQVLYRPWEKGFLLTKKLAAPASVLLERLGKLGQSAPAQERKLEAIWQYASAAETGPKSALRCRRAFILEYFGQSTEVPCGACDLCAPEYRYPWSELTERDTAQVADYFDPAFVLLETVYWNSRQAEERRRNPYSANKLLLVLRGNSYQLTNRYPPADRSWRLQLLRNCPYWSVFDSLAKGDERLQKHLDRLYAEGYLEEIEKDFDKDGVTRSYRYPQLSAKGAARLVSGEYLGWTD